MTKIKSILGKAGNLLKRLFTINGSPHDIALGFALGVFLGILPGTGPVAALVLAQFLRLNRAAALAGALLTNTWFSLLVLGLSAQAGAMIMRVNLAELNRSIAAAFTPFHFSALFKLSFGRVLLPLAVGYALVSIAIGVIAYLAAYAILRLRRRKQGHPR